MAIVGARARGFGLLELMGALALGTLLVAGLASLIGRSLDDLRQQHTAAYQQRFAAAAAQYLRANQATLYQQAAAGTVAVTAAQMKAAGAAFLPAGFAAANPYGQAPCLLVRRAGQGLAALAVSEGGEAIADAGLAYIAAHAGAGGGAIKLRADAPGPAAGGAFGSWQLDAAALSAYTAAHCSAVAASGGHLASALFADARGQLPADFLYRDPVPGRPELNQMNVPLRMAGAALVQAGAACDGRAQIALDQDRNIVSCGLDHVWNNTGNDTWREPVADYAALQALAAEPDGTVRVTLDTGRAFVHTQGAWKALAVDQDGNLRVDNRLTAGSAVVAGDVAVGTDLKVGHDVSADNVNVGAGVYAESLEASGWTVSPSYEFTYLGDPSWGEYATPGQACHIILPALPDGTIPIMYPISTQMPDKNGITMICHAPERQFKYLNGTMSP